MTPVISSLTPREEQVLHLTAAGCGEREIAGRLGLTVYAIRAHKANARGKLGASSTVHAVALYVASVTRTPG